VSEWKILAAVNPDGGNNSSEAVEGRIIQPGSAFQRLAEGRWKRLLSSSSGQESLSKPSAYPRMRDGNLPVRGRMRIELVVAKPIVLSLHGIDIQSLVSAELILNTVMGNPEVHHDIRRVVRDRCRHLLRWQTLGLTIDIRLMQGFDQLPINEPPYPVRNPLNGKHTPLVHGPDDNFVFPGPPLPGAPPFPCIESVNQVCLELVRAPAFEFDVDFLPFPR